MQVAAGSIIGGKYRLDRPVSRGGMGAVWAGRHVHLGSPVAVKFMDPTFADSPAFRARFEREARAAASLQSPHVVGVQDYGIDGGTPYIVMELLQGEDLHARLERCGRLGLVEASSLLAQLGKALRRAHEIGLVHRDLKPRNIFLARIDDDEVVKILDFGIAKDTVSKNIGEVTNTGELMGSPHYMSPEQLRADKDLDARSDLWALGVILFRCLTGHLPFPGDALGTVMAKILVDPIPPVIPLAPDLPPSLDAFFARALARDRAARFQSVRDMVDAFRTIAGGAPFGVTSTGTPASPFASTPAFGTRAPIAGAPLIEPAVHAPGPPAWSPVRSSLPGATPAGLTPATPAGLTPAASAGTLTTVGMVAGDPGMRARRMRAVWVAGAGTGLLAVVIGMITALRFGGDDDNDKLTAGPPAPATQAPPVDPPPVIAPAAPPPAAPTVRPVEEQPIDLDAVAPKPLGSARPLPAASASAKPAPKPAKPGSTSEPAKAPDATGAKKPSWGF